MIPWLLLALLAAAFFAYAWKAGGRLRASRETEYAMRREIERLEAHRADERERTKAMLANMQEAVLLVADDDRVLLANQAFYDLFSGLGEDDEPRAAIAAVTENGQFLEHLQAVRKRRAAGRREVEFSGDNKSVWAEITGSRVPGMGPVGDEATLLIVHDVTRLRKLESVRKEFVANVSHELRTPLSLIKGYVETLCEDAPGKASPTESDRRRFLGIIAKHTGRLERLVEDLLALSRLESGNPNLRKEELVVEALLEELAENYRPRGDASRRLVLDLEVERRPVIADPLRLAQVLGNLFENAVKYSGDSAAIEAGTRREGAMLRVWVGDNGIGISREHLPHIFERFYRVDKGRSRESGGTGLGLSIVKHIVQLHGGRVWADSRPGAGLRISFTLPLAVSGSSGKD